MLQCMTRSDILALLEPVIDPDLGQTLGALGAIHDVEIS
ncbi:MAG: DUF59 domain-containing protein, partial [Candidatus Kapabacteria bacterium]|nr:DUF59 domain-containing protein [Candidatus Kapabacteria bacterium]